MFDQLGGFSFFTIFSKLWQLLRRQPLYSLLVFTLLIGLIATAIGGYFLWQINQEMSRAQNLTHIDGEFGPGSTADAVAFEGLLGESSGLSTSDSTGRMTTGSIDVPTGSSTTESTTARSTIESPIKSSMGSTAPIQVYVSGQVELPGVHLLAINSRVGHAIDAAGGFTELADQDYVARQLNLARMVVDGEQIYVPGFDEVEHDQSTAGDSSNPIGTGDGLISVNSASAVELQALTGIGEKRAEDIMDGRPYAKLEDLVVKKIITQSMFDQISAEIKL